MDEHGAESPEMYRWQGRVDSEIIEMKRRLADINGDAKAARIASENLLIELAVLRTKVAVWSAAGGLIGAGIMSVIVAIVTGGSA
jgi:hypothetical protein